MPINNNTILDNIKNNNFFFLNFFQHDFFLFFSFDFVISASLIFFGSFVLLFCIMIRILKNHHPSILMAGGLAATVASLYLDFTV